MQDKVAEGEKGEQSHIVRYQHRADKGYVYQNENGYFCSSEFSYYSLSQGVEKSDISKGAYNCQDAEKTGESLEIKISEILAVGRNDK